MEAPSEQKLTIRQLQEVCSPTSSKTTQMVDIPIPEEMDNANAKIGVAY